MPDQSDREMGLSCTGKNSITLAAEVDLATVSALEFARLAKATERQTCLNRPRSLLRLESPRTPMQTNPTRPTRKTAERLTSGQKTLPQPYFVSAEVFEQEVTNIFSKHWLLIGHQSEISDPGDYFLASVPSSSDHGLTAESLIVTRDQSGEIRGFFNVCRHRGSRLRQDASGHASAIQCPYHAWTYALDGRLVAAPHMDEVQGFDKADYRLKSVDLGIWEGFVFVSLANTDALTAASRASLPAGEREKRRGVSLEDWFAPLTGKFSHWKLPSLRSAKRIDYEVRANWKLIFENYSECYHCPGVHPMLSKISPSDSAENDLTEGPFLGGFMKIKEGAGLTVSGRVCALRIDQEQELAAASPSEGGQEQKQLVFYYSIFPNMLLSLHPEYVMVHQLWPQAPDRTLIVCDWFFHPEAFDRKDFNPNDAIEFWDITNKQDWHVCELSQQGIRSRAYRPGPYSSRESIPAAFDREYLRFMGESTK
jgi:Rieske 2Fe-2S family protein